MSKFTPGMLLQWKSSAEHWGFYHGEKPQANSFRYKSRILEPHLYQEYSSQKLTLLNNKSSELISLLKLYKSDSKEYKENAFQIITKYNSLLEQLSDQYSIYDYQYSFIALEPLIYSYSIGSVFLKKRVFWKVMLVNRAKETKIFWVSEDDIEPFEEEGYDPKKDLLTKHLRRKSLRTSE